ncbi:hypothetical protein GSI_12244 [Ganoderma sinense ZZ0214-1]|uniref:Uncharacterized protein n=1 Tax=Ganoderma sinense ZZ0214-1 TaxID=1077348 RepID=A0A2G8RY93_9APHY|nr:hypothetical protein GSI_12244 [Ganoderma sinense ZZ0214-1]
MPMLIAELMISRENIHSETYAYFVKTFVMDAEERDRLFGAIETVPSVKAKAEWCFKWFDREAHSFATRLLAFAIVEGRGVLPGLCFSNELIARDEEMHMRFACLLYAELTEKVPADTVYGMMMEAVELEKRFFSDALVALFDGLNAAMMADYVEFTADYVLLCMKYEPLYNTSNPFMFMTMLRLPGRSNFFERPVSEYSGAVVGWGPM